MHLFSLSPRALARLLSLDDFEAAAHRFLPGPLFGYMSNAAEDRTTLRQNRSAFGAWGFVPRVLVDVSHRTQAVSLFGHDYAAPFGIAPLGMSALTAYRGDLVLAQAARAANIPMIMSGSSLIRLEEVAAAAPGAWFQAYLPGEPAAILALIERVKAAGFGTLVITVDTPVMPNRENNARARFSAPLRPSLRLAVDGLTHPRWLAGTFLRTLLNHGMPHFENNYAQRGAPIMSATVLRDFADRGHLTWDHLAQVRAAWPGNLVVKGILHPDDARRACALGANAIVVSNHGGRQLDGAIAPLLALEAVVAACGDVPVLFDSGVRRGADVLKALALGARMVLVGRPFGYAAAVGGEAGVRRAIGLLADEVSRNMAMLGIASAAQMDATYLLRLERK